MVKYRTARPHANKVTYANGVLTECLAPDKMVFKGHFLFKQQPGYTNPFEKWVQGPQGAGGINIRGCLTFWSR